MSVRWAKEIENFKRQALIAFARKIAFINRKEPWVYY